MPGFHLTVNERREGAIFNSLPILRIVGEVA